MEEGQREAMRQRVREASSLEKHHLCILSAICRVRLGSSVRPGQVGLMSGTLNIELHRMRYWTTKPRVLMKWMVTEGFGRNLPWLELWRSCEAFRGAVRPPVNRWILRGIARCQGRERSSAMCILGPVRQSLTLRASISLILLSNLLVHIFLGQGRIYNHGQA